MSTPASRLIPVCCHEAMPDTQGLVLVAEDDPSIAELERAYLSRAGFGVHVERDGGAAWEAIQRLRPVLLVLDVALPSIDGVELCRRLRGASDWTPVIFVTARGEEIDRLIGLELGADDYLAKPFSPRELVARVKAVLRRTAMTPRGHEAPVLEVGAVRLDPTRRLVLAKGEPLELTAKEFDLLHALMEHPGRVFTRSQLLSAVWGQVEYASSRTVDVHVAQLRAKLGDASPLRTVRGVGYAADS